MGARHLRQTCEATLRTLDLPRPFTVDAFCAALAHDRDRPIRLVPMPTGAAVPCGLWVSTDAADYVIHQVATSPLHRDHIILHELAHMIFDHTTVRQPAAPLSDRLLPDLDPQMVATVLARGAYSTVQEQEAETLADLIGSRASRRPPSPSDPALARTMDVFGPAT